MRFTCRNCPVAFNISRFMGLSMRTLATVNVIAVHLLLILRESPVSCRGLVSVILKPDMDRPQSRFEYFCHAASVTFLTSTLVSSSRNEKLILTTTAILKDQQQHATQQQKEPIAIQHSHLQTADDGQLHQRTRDSIVLT